jgi:hypothetical protein
MRCGLTADGVAWSWGTGEIPLGRPLPHMYATVPLEVPLP